MNESFKELIRTAAGNGGGFSRTPDKEEWDALLKTAQKQSLVGVTFEVMDNMPEEMGPRLATYGKWALLDEKIRDRHALAVERTKELYTMVKDTGLECCILKGAGLARFYPTPSRRQAGDIDIWVKGSRNDTLAAFGARFRTDEVHYHHCDAHIFPDIKVEVHFTPSWMNNPFANRRLQNYFREQSGRQFSHFDPELGVPVPTMDFNAVYCMLHIYRHILAEGIGLRQMMDYCYILKALPEEMIEDVRKDMKRLGLKKCASAVMYVLKDVFALDDRYLLFEPDEKYGSYLVREISLSGNFGRYDRRNASLNTTSPMKKAYARMARLSRYTGFAPSEVFFAPLFKGWQFIWKKVHFPK